MSWSSCFFGSHIFLKWHVSTYSWNWPLSGCPHEPAGQVSLMACALLSCKWGAAAPPCRETMLHATARLLLAALGVTADHTWVFTGIYRHSQAHQKKHTIHFRLHDKNNAIDQASSTSGNSAMISPAKWAENADRAQRLCGMVWPGTGCRSQRLHRYGAPSWFDWVRFQCCRGFRASAQEAQNLQATQVSVPWMRFRPENHHRLLRAHEEETQ